MSEQVFSIERRVSWWRRHLIPLSGFGCVLALTVRDTPEPIVVIAVAAGTFLCEWWWPVPRETVFVAVTDQTIRVGDRTVAWSEIDGAQASEGRIELLRGSQTLVTIEQESVERYDELVQTIARRANVAAPELRASSLSVDAVPIFLLLGLMVLVAVLWSPWIGGGAFVLYGGWRLLDPYRMDFDDDGLRMRSVFFRTWFIPRAHIRSIYLTVGPNGRVQTRAEVRGCAPMKLALHRVDPLLIFEKARRAYPELVA